MGIEEIRQFEYLSKQVIESIRALPSDFAIEGELAISSLLELQRALEIERLRSMERPLDQDIRGLQPPREDLDYALTSRAGWEMFGFSSSLMPFYSFQTHRLLATEVAAGRAQKEFFLPEDAWKSLNWKVIKGETPIITPDGKLFGEGQVKPRPRVEFLEPRVVFHPSRVVHASNHGLQARLLEFLDSQDVEVHFVDPYWLNGKVSELQVSKDKRILYLGNRVDEQKQLRALVRGCVEAALCTFDTPNLAHTKPVMNPLVASAVFHAVAYANNLTTRPYSTSFLEEWPSRLDPSDVGKWAQVVEVYSSELLSATAIETSPASTLESLVLDLTSQTQDATNEDDQALLPGRHLVDLVQNGQSTGQRHSHHWGMTETNQADSVTVLTEREGLEL